MKIHGNNVVLSHVVNNQTVVIGGAKSCEIDIDCDTVQRSSPSLSSAGWKKFIAKRKSWRVNLSHLIESDDVTPATALQMVGTSVTLSIDIVGMTGERVTGTAIVKQWRGTAQRDGLAKGTFVFQGTGALE